MLLQQYQQIVTELRRTSGGLPDPLVVRILVNPCCASIRCFWSFDFNCDGIVSVRTLLPPSHRPRRHAPLPQQAFSDDLFKGLLKKLGTPGTPSSSLLTAPHYEEVVLPVLRRASPTQAACPAQLVMLSRPCTLSAAQRREAVRHVCRLAAAHAATSIDRRGCCATLRILISDRALGGNPAACRSAASCRSVAHGLLSARTSQRPAMRVVANPPPAMAHAQASRCWPRA
jgi:hypothetical protein